MTLQNSLVPAPSPKRRAWSIEVSLQESLSRFAFIPPIHTNTTSFTITDMFKRWFRKKVETDPPRLSKEGALALARTAAVGYSAVNDLSIARFKTEDGSRQWTVSSATMGKILEVVIDDATGTVLDIKELGVR